jgi:serine/threonine-protein kinase
VSDYPAGGTLRDLLTREGALPPLRAIDVAIDLCRALGALADRGIVHRDVKPENVWLGAGGMAQLAGCGVAQEPDETRLTQEPGAHPGTPAYKSPEQAASFGALDARSDLYALGLVLYEACAGRPYARDGIPPSRHNPAVPAALDGVILRALQERPSDRYASPAEMQAALEQVRDQNPWGQLHIVAQRLAAGRLGAIALAVALLAIAAACCGSRRQ